MSGALRGFRLVDLDGFTVEVFSTDEIDELDQILGLSALDEARLSNAFDGMSQESAYHQVG